MRSEPSLMPLAASAVIGFTLCAAVALSSDFAIAASEAKPAAPSCTCPEKSQKPWSRPKFAEIKHAFDENDEIAALESVQFALTELGDGATYVWHRAHGRLSGVVQPTASFKDSGGTVCRHVVVMLTSGANSKKTEGIACRLPSGIWQLDG